ncbi:MAG TPA: hypothetical protein VGJ26_12545 [Pirellulales bacterium]|jgi:hypothetical protein
MSTPPRRRWFRFSLRTLLFIVIVIAIPLAWIARERRQSSYEEQIADSFSNSGRAINEFGGAYDLWELQNQPQGWWKDLARRVMGDRLIQAGPPTFDFNDLTPISASSNLQVLYLHETSVSDLTPLVGQSNLLILLIMSTQVSDLTPLAELKRLQELYLYETPVRELAPLARLKNLRILSFSATQVGDLTPLAGLTKLEHLNSLA